MTGATLRRRAIVLYSYCRGYAEDFTVEASEERHYFELRWKATVERHRYSGYYQHAGDESALVRLLEKAEETLMAASVKELVHSLVRADRRRRDRRRRGEL